MLVCPSCRTQCEEGLSTCPVDGTPLGVQQELIGQILGDRYRLLSRMGEGGMGTVFLAEHVALGKRMALKVLRPEYSRDEELVRRFEQEARAASQIGHDNIVDVVDFGRTPGGSLYFAMEALEGESLARRIRREGALPLGEALLILAQVCRALGAAHARGVVHRDLKPENVFLSRRENGSCQVKVLDFGISRTFGVPDGGRITRAGSIIGTPEYMAPEQAMATAVDHRCDIYSFGVLAYEMLTGTLPFRGETPLATLLMHQATLPEPPRRRRPAIGPEAEALVLKALVKRPEGRYQDMGEVAADLSRALAAAGLAPLDAASLGMTPPPPSGGTARFPSPRRPSARGETIALPPDDVVPPPRSSGSGASWTVPRSREATPPPSFERVRRRPPALLLGGASAAALAALGVATGLVPFSRLPSVGSPGPASGTAAAAAGSAAPATGILLAAAPAAPLPSPARLRVRILSVPGGAEVFEGGERVGATPLDVELETGSEVEYRFVRPGYRALARRIEASEGVVEVRLSRAALRGSPRSRRELGGRAEGEENPYGKVDDLKPDPFLEDP